MIRRPPSSPLFPYTPLFRPPLADAPASCVADGIAREVARVATASGVRIGEDEATKQWRAMAGLTGANRSSMLQDVEAGRPPPIDPHSGAAAPGRGRPGAPRPPQQPRAPPVR